MRDDERQASAIAPLVDGQAGAELLSTAAGPLVRLACHSPGPHDVRRHLVDRELLKTRAGRS